MAADDPLFDAIRRRQPGRVPLRLHVVYLDGEEVVQIPPQHGADFRTLIWGGIRYHFTRSQAAAVRLLWEAWESGLPELSQEYVLAEIESDADKLSDLFKGNPAWGNVIVHAGKGMVRLAELGADRTPLPPPRDA